MAVEVGDRISFAVGSAPALSGAEIALNSRRSALKVLLSVVSIFFMLMIVAYGGRMLYQDWRPAKAQREDLTGTGPRVKR